MSTAAGLTGGIGYLIGAGLYVKAIWAPGRQKPDRLSWLGWSIQATALTLPLSQALSPTGHARYATATALALPAAQALSSWLIFVLTLRPGRGRSLTDWLADVTSLLGTAAAVTLWAASRGAVLPTAALLLIEGIGVARTAWWAWRSPGCEPLLPWCVWAGCGACEFFAVPAGASWVAAWFYPVFYAACGLLVAGAAGRRRVSGWVKPGGWFIQEQQAHWRHDAGRDAQPPLHAAGVGVHPIGVWPDQRRQDPDSGALAGAAPPGQAEDTPLRHG